MLILNKQKQLIKIEEKGLLFNSELVLKWYHNKAIIKNIMVHSKNKYYSFITYKEFDKITKPSRWNCFFKEKDYKFVLAKHYIGYKPVSMYKDLDNWKEFKPLFKCDWEEKSKKLKELDWNNKEVYNKFQLNPDFGIDIDGTGIVETWPIVKRF